MMTNAKIDVNVNDTKSQGLSHLVGNLFLLKVLGKGISAIIFGIKMTNKIIVNQLYEHIKTGKIYLVLMIVKRELDSEEMIVYKDFTSENLPWVRPKNEFVEKFRRFTLC